MQTAELERQIKKIVFKEIDSNQYKVFLFGSRANGDFRGNSDRDIGILGKERLDFEKYLEIKSKLNELPCLIDLVDFKKTDENFRKIALKKIKKWN